MESIFKDSMEHVLSYKKEYRQYVKNIMLKIEEKDEELNTFIEEKMKNLFDELAHQICSMLSTILVDEVHIPVQAAEDYAIKILEKITQGNIREELLPQRLCMGKDAKGKRCLCHVKGDEKFCKKHSKAPKKPITIFKDQGSTGLKLEDFKIPTLF